MLRFPKSRFLLRFHQVYVPSLGLCFFFVIAFVQIGCLNSTLFAEVSISQSYCESGFSFCVLSQFLQPLKCYQNYLNVVSSLLTRGRTAAVFPVKLHYVSCELAVRSGSSFKVSHKNQVVLWKIQHLNEHIICQSCARVFLRATEVKAVSGCGHQIFPLRFMGAALRSLLIFINNQWWAIKNGSLCAGYKNSRNHPHARLIIIRKSKSYDFILPNKSHWDGATKTEVGFASYKLWFCGCPILWQLDSDFLFGKTVTTI